MTTPRYSQPPPPLPPPPPPTNRQYHVHYISPAHSAPNPNYYSPASNYNPLTDRRRSSSAHGSLHSPKDHKHVFEPYSVQQRRRSLSPRPTNGTNSDSPPSSEPQSPDTASQKHNGDQKKTTQSAKRAAQNRAAQRAFRQRRERYVKDLEIRAKEMDAMQEEMNKLMEQNMAYRQQIDILTRELKSFKDNGGGNNIPYMNGHKAGMAKASSSPTPQETKLESSQRRSTIPREGTFEAEMARRLSHSDHAKPQQSSGPSESLYSLQQRRNMHAATRKPTIARSDSHQLPIPISNPATITDQKTMTTYNHKHNDGPVVNATLDRSKESPHTKPVPPNGKMYMPAPVIENGYPARTEAGMLPQPPAYSNMPQFIHQFGQMDQANSELVEMMDMPPLALGEGEFEMEDPFAAEDGADELDFAPEDCDRILDDLVTILQQRNRPQIPHNLNPSEAA